MKKNIVIIIICLLLVVSGVYIFMLRKQLTKAEDILVQYSDTIDSLRNENEIESKRAQENYLKALTERNNAIEKRKSEEALKKPLK
jgi:uncharacterized protein YxeA